MFYQKQSNNSNPCSRIKLVEIFVTVDDFCKEISETISTYQLEDGISNKRNRKCCLSDSEIITILIAFHSGHFTNFKHFYLEYAKVNLADCFPTLPSYNRFIELQQRVGLVFMLFVKFKCMGKSAGINFIDSTHIHVCHNRRIHQHKVFEAVAERGQCSLGWFYGFKLHLIINEKGEVFSFYLTKGNVDERNVKVLTTMTENVFGNAIFGISRKKFSSNEKSNTRISRHKFLPSRQEYFP